MTLAAPFPWFGGKRRAAHLVWPRFGNVPNYVEPFAGSLAVLLARPHPAKIETVNDKDCYLANFWRALRHDPEGVAAWSDWPVNEADLHARHKWLLARDDFRERMTSEPDYYNTQIAGWWVWGQCSWIGAGWCIAEVRQLPHLGNAGLGLHRITLKDPRAYLLRLSRRLRRVRVCCGDWSRVMGDTATWRHGTTAILLDPPYDTATYYRESDQIATDVRAWAIENGDDERLRIAFCGYEGEGEMPDSWECVAWKANGGYSNQGDDNENASRERIWFSPHCIKKEQQMRLIA